jgi:hypothetical protein
MVWWRCVADNFRGREVDLIQNIVVTIPLAIGSNSILFFSLFSMFPKLKYLESNKTEKPTFKAMCSSIIDVPKDFDFDRLKTEIAEKWLITFSDDTNRVLKFRDKWSFSTTWGASAWMKYHDDTRKLHLECFPTAGNHFELSQKMQKEIENCIELNDLFALTLAQYDHLAPSTPQPRTNSIRLSNY